MIELAKLNGFSAALAAYLNNRFNLTARSSRLQVNWALGEYLWK